MCYKKFESEIKFELFYLIKETNFVSNFDPTWILNLKEKGKNFAASKGCCQATCLSPTIVSQTRISLVTNSENLGSKDKNSFIT